MTTTMRMSQAPQRASLVTAVPEKSDRASASGKTEFLAWCVRMDFFCALEVENPFVCLICRLWMFCLGIEDRIICLLCQLIFRDPQHIQCLWRSFFFSISRKPICRQGSDQKDKKMHSLSVSLPYRKLAENDLFICSLCQLMYQYPYYSVFPLHISHDT